MATGTSGRPDFPQVRTLRTYEDLSARLLELGIELPVDAEVDPSGPLAEPLMIGDRLEVANRFCVLPMEGWDGEADGRASDLVRRRWRRFGASGAGLVWAEATAVDPAGRANPRQLVINEDSVDDLGALRSEMRGQVVGLQLTHSGRWSRPDGDLLPRIAYRHPLLDERVGADDEAVLTDAELDALVVRYVEAARLADQADFDFVDIKHCHGYLAHELLSAVDRPGRFGGSLDNRMRLLRLVIEGIRADAPRLAIAVRLSAFDLLPGGFGVDGTGAGIDLTEPHEFLRRCAEWGVSLVSVTAGSPYYTPHIQRPAYFPPSDGYPPPRDPLIEVAQLLSVTAELSRAHPSIAVVASGCSYLQQWLPHLAQGIIRSGTAALVGYGRMALSYPDLPADVLAGEPLDRRRICRTLSDCTTAPRNGLVSGCYPYDPFYKAMPERQLLAVAKRKASA